MTRSPNIAKNVLEAALRRMQRSGFESAAVQAGFSKRDARIGKAVLHDKVAFAELLQRFEQWIEDDAAPEKHDELTRWLWTKARTKFILAIKEMAGLYNLQIEPAA